MRWVLLLAGFGLFCFSMGNVSYLLGLREARPDLLALGVVFFSTMRRPVLGLVSTFFCSVAVAAQSAASLPLVFLVAVTLYLMISFLSLRLLLKHPVHLAFLAALISGPSRELANFYVFVFKSSTLVTFWPNLSQLLLGTLATFIVGVPAYALARQLDRKLRPDTQQPQFLPDF